MTCKYGVSAGTSKPRYAESRTGARMQVLQPTTILAVCTIINGYLW